MQILITIILDSLVTLNILKINLNLEKKSISYHGVEIWNNISDNIKNSKNIKSFKVNYKNFLVSHY